VRILTRYILGEIISLTLIGGALFTFILFMPQLPQILQVVVRNSSTLTDVAQVFCSRCPTCSSSRFPWRYCGACCWG
jgi:lipopolysaccharide export LptBFGC system permease protein LptF